MGQMIESADRRDKVGDRGGRERAERGREIAKPLYYTVNNQGPNKHTVFLLSN